jgi:hypothetical protein
MNLENENQHYISAVLLRRLKTPGSPLHCYQISTCEWEEKSIEKLCSAEGYNQLVVPGEKTNNSLEASISRVESKLPKTFKALEHAAQFDTMELPAAIYQNLREYCAFLKLSSLFSKASAVVSFLHQINMELERGEYFLWRELQIPQSIIDGFRLEYANNGRVIIETENALQLVYRLQFERLLQTNIWEFSRTDWAICSSQIDLPMSDAGIVPINLEKLEANHYLLPLGPRLLLEGVFYRDQSKNAIKTSIRGFRMTEEEAQYRADCLCSSSIKEIIFSKRSADVETHLARAAESGLKFHRVAQLEQVLSAGAKPASRNYTFKCVPKEEYARFMHSFVLPPLNPQNLNAATSGK